MGTALSAAATGYRQLSFWFDDLVTRGLDDLEPRAGLPGDRHVDVCIIGAGFTGLWAALAIREADPDATIAIVEQEIAGFGASGRNGGWCSALFPVSDGELERRHGRNAALAMRRALTDTVQDVGEQSRALGIDCDFEQRGTRVIIRGGAAEQAARREQVEAARLGVDQPVPRDDPPLGRSLWEPNCASLHPGKLVRGLARAAVAAGVQLWERTRVLHWGPHEVTTDRGTVRCDRLVVATEAWGATLAPSRRHVLPLYSLMLATEPLTDAVWEAIGLAAGETVTDFRHLLVYGQRTADGRLAFGGRGARYHAGSSIRPAWDRSPGVHRHLEEALVGLFPAAAGARITHRWGGPIGVPRDWHPTILPSRDGAVVWAGGYVGDGVAASRLAGQTIGDLVTGVATPRTSLPWVGHRSPRWEPEPWRSIGVNGVITAMGAADAEESATGRPSRIAALALRLSRA